MASAADLLLEPMRAEIARRLPKPMMDALRDRDRRARRRCRRRSAPRVSSPRRVHDRPVGRRAGAARPHPVARHARHRRRTRSPRSAPTRRPAATRLAFAFHGHYIVPGFIDVHVHGVDGVDSLDARPDGDAVAAIAARLPRYGVTAFCPTTVACAPGRRCGACSTRCGGRAKLAGRARGARAAGASGEQFHQPGLPRRAAVGLLAQPSALRSVRLDRKPGRSSRAQAIASSTAADILAEIERAAPDVGIVTLAPELDGGLDLVRWLCSRGHRVSLGHSAATYEQALAAIAAGARHATHLFNRMPPLGHRAPGLAGAVLQTDEVAAEIICDGVPRAPGAGPHGDCRQAAVAHLRDHRRDGRRRPAGRLARASLGGQPIVAGESTALLADGTIAGSVADDGPGFSDAGGPGRAFRWSTRRRCARPRRRVSSALVGHGVLALDAVADLVVLDAARRRPDLHRRPARLRTATY